MMISYSMAGCAPSEYPTEILFALILCKEGDFTSVPRESPFQSEWGLSNSFGYALDDEHSEPESIDCIWLSLSEQKFYSLERSLKGEMIAQLVNKASEDQTIILGMAPYGRLALWVNSLNKSYIVEWFHAEEIDIEMADYFQGCCNMSRGEYCEMILQQSNKGQKTLPPRDLFDNYMKQFTYRYLFLFEHWDKDNDEWQKYNEEETAPELDYIEEALFDGTHDKLHDGGLMNYHQAGKPKKLAVKWHIKKSEYSAYFWFEDEEIRTVFDRFYGAHPETKTDFMIRIDSDKKKFELALYRYGLKEPQVISESAYQLLVFKNKFEYYRSENYNQPKGAWIW